MSIVRGSHGRSAGAGQKSSDSEFRGPFDKKAYQARIYNQFPGPKGRWKSASAARQPVPQGTLEAEPISHSAVLSGLGIMEILKEIRDYALTAGNA
jgi:hypothetical protein